MLGGAKMTPEIAAAIDAEQSGATQAAPKKPKGTRAA